MIKISLKKTGVDGLVSALDAAPNVKFAKAVARLTFSQFAAETRDKLRANTPVSTGNLRRATKSKGTPGGGAKVYISRDGSTSGKGYHSHIVEKGTKARRTKKGAGRGVMPATNYQAPVLQEARGEFDRTVKDRIEKKLRERIRAEIAKGRMS